MNNKISFIFAVVLTVVPACVHAVNFGNVMPLGDSITYGMPVLGGYRDPLYRLLTANGHTLRFVGTQNANGTALLNGKGQQYHQGMVAWPISSLYDNINTWMAATNPDVILLMIGTNDCIVNNLAGAPARLDALVERIFTNKPTVRLLLATLVPNNTPATQANIDSLNLQIPGIVASHQALGRNIQLVLMHNALTAPGDLADGVHPNAGGYNKMANTWFSAMIGTNTGTITAAGVSVSAETNNTELPGYPTASKYTGDIVDNDLIDTHSITLSSWTRDKEPAFERDILNDGIGHAADTSSTCGTWWPATYEIADLLPATYTYKLNTTIVPTGYRIFKINSYAGWSNNGSCLANQKYEVLVDYVDEDPAFISLGVFEYSPFASTSTAEAGATKMTLTSITGKIASGVSSIRFVLMDHGYANGNVVVDGSVYFEIDVIGDDGGYCLSHPIGDLSGDCIVDLSDLAILSLHWLDDDGSYCLSHPIGDLSGDCIVDLSDLAILSLHWMEDGRQ